jgi:hypothetical protein
MARKNWIPADELRDSAVVARLMIHDVVGARDIFGAPAPYSTRVSGDFRSALLASHIQAMESRP